MPTIALSELAAAADSRLLAALQAAGLAVAVTPLAAARRRGERRVLAAAERAAAGLPAPEGEE